MIWIFCIAVFGLQFIVALLLQIGKRKTPKDLKSDPNKVISIIIPFHNEATRIQGLIDSLNSVDDLSSFEFIFVDDHSNDETVQLLNDKLQIPFDCIKNIDKKGKKYAIRSGVHQAKNAHIITWDADIIVLPKYFKEVAQLPEADLNIMPVRMVSSGLLGKLAIVEFTFLETLGFGSAGFGQPTICYGANLGFKKKAFLAVDDKRSDYDIVSGDDLFLMSAMQKNGMNIQHNYSQNVTVKTTAPKSLIALLRQRKRWFGKMKTLINGTTIFPLLLLLIVQIAGVISWVLCFTNPWFLIPIGIKYLAEILASWQFVKRNALHWIIILMHQFWYPVFCLLLLLPTKKELRWNN